MGKDIVHVHTRVDPKFHEKLRLLVFLRQAKNRKYSLARLSKEALEREVREAPELKEER